MRSSPCPGSGHLALYLLFVALDLVDIESVVFLVFDHLLVDLL